MSIKIIESEIKRFLASPDAEVLCVKGKWGVGKTFAWMQYLRDAEKHDQLALKKYAYVSLFGLNDLEALRYAIFESTVTTGQFLSGPDVESLSTMLDGVKSLARKGRPLYAAAVEKFGGSGAVEALSRAAFLSVRKQIICLDDLERRGISMTIRDVLGLVSLLKEQRRCKIILLLNDEQLEKLDKEELERQLEKVVDVSLAFEPSPEEAVAIAFANETQVNIKLRERITKLGITNIRVMKKIERLADRLFELLSPFREEVRDHGIHAVALGGWSALQPDIAPPINFLNQYNSLLSAMRNKEGDKPENERGWEEIIERYGWSHTDELDLAVFEGVVAGYFDERKISETAAKIQAELENNKENNAFSKAWKRYHHSFVINDNEVLDGIYEGAKQSMPSISPLNLNGTTKLLREFGRDDQANELIKLYIAQPNLNPEWLDEDLSMWGKEDVDPALAAAFAQLKANKVDTRDPQDILVAMVTSRSWSEADIILLARQNPEDFEKVFESIEGPNLSAVVKFAVSLGTMEGENHKLVGLAINEGLRRIARKSPLRKRKIENLGVTFVV